LKNSATTKKDPKKIPLQIISNKNDLFPSHDPSKYSQKAIRTLKMIKFSLIILQMSVPKQLKSNPTRRIGE
jgi:signal recognition particle receptor subunit beta